MFAACFTASAQSDYLRVELAANFLPSGVLTQNGNGKNFPAFGKI
jgi:hypothetical protein